MEQGPENNNKIVNRGEALKDASACGQLEEVKLLLSQDNSYFAVMRYWIMGGGISKKHKEEALQRGARYGHFEVVKYLLENAFSYSDCPLNLYDTYSVDLTFNEKYTYGVGSGIKTLGLALKGGNLNVVEYLLNKIPIESFDLLNNTPTEDFYNLEGSYIYEMILDPKNLARNNCLEAYKYFINHEKISKNIDQKRILDLFAQKGSLEMVQFLTTKNELPVTDDAFMAAAKNGHLTIVTYLTPHISSKRIYERAFLKANKYNHLNVVEYFLSLGVISNTTKGEALEDNILHKRYDMVNLLCTKKISEDNKAWVHLKMRLKDHTDNSIEHLNKSFSYIAVKPVDIAFQNYQTKTKTNNQQVTTVADPRKEKRRSI